MRLKMPAVTALISFLLGASWAMSVIGALSGLLTNYHYGFFHAVASLVVWALPGLFFVAFLEYMLAGLERCEEAKKQTMLLEKILRNQEGSARQQNSS